MNEWDERFDYYAGSSSHAQGDDLDQVVAWCEPAPGVTALDVATGGGHVGRRLRELGCAVTTCDAAAGMKPDVVSPAEALAFSDGSFDVVVCRVAAHHFTDPAMAIREMARVGRRLVVFEDTLWVDELVQRAEVVRDATHVSHYTRDQFVEMLDAAGLEVLAEARFPRRHVLDDWLSATGCAGAAAAEVRRLLAHVAEPDGSAWTDVKWAAKAVKRP
ncbi:MAG TPA: class I SAM-dependent methyltransferase [Thermoleophilia bacterium]